MRITVEVKHARTCALASVSVQHEGGFALVRESRIGKSELDLGLIGEPSQLTLPEKWHRADNDSAGLEHCEPAGRKHRIVRPAQQYTIARDYTELIYENIRNSIRGLMEMPVGPFATRKPEYQPVSISGLNYAVEQFRRGIHHVWICQLRDSAPLTYWPQIGGGRVLRAKHVDGFPPRLFQCPLSPNSFKTWPAIISFWTSVVPSYIRSARISRYSLSTG
jgi:hypothetical protein